MHWPYWLQIGLCHILSLLCFRETKIRKKMKEVVILYNQYASNVEYNLYKNENY